MSYVCHMIENMTILHEEFFLFPTDEEERENSRLRQVIGLLSTFVSDFCQIDILNSGSQVFDSSLVQICTIPRRSAIEKRDFLVIYLHWRSNSAGISQINPLPNRQTLSLVSWRGRNHDDELTFVPKSPFTARSFRFVGMKMSRASLCRWRKHLSPDPTASFVLPQVSVPTRIEWRTHRHGSAQMLNTVTLEAYAVSDELTRDKYSIEHPKSGKTIEHMLTI